jgi:hypothetical protein
MKLTNNHLFINLILSGFAYAYILHQLNTFLHKKGVPFTSARTSNEDEFKELLIGFPNNLVFIAFSILHSFTFYTEDMEFWVCLFLGAFIAFCSYFIAMGILLFSQAIALPIRILMILVCLALCMYGKFSILNWKF